MSAQEYLPLAPVEFHVLLSLAEQERHGYGIIQDAEARTGGADSPDVASSSPRACTTRCVEPPAGVRTRCRSICAAARCRTF